MIDYSIPPPNVKKIEPQEENYINASFCNDVSSTVSIHNEEIPTPEDIEREFPFLVEHEQFVRKSRKNLEAIIGGLDPRQFLIVGPCSIHDVNSAKEYAARFRLLADEVSDQFFLMMRAYVEKPRTALGWKGILYDPDLDGSYHLSKGIRITRKLLIELTEMGIPLASELLEINTSHYYSDFLTWGCIGARTSTSPPHRQLASSLSFPIGFKNTTDGNVDNSIRAILSASTPHVFLGPSKKGNLSRIQGKGNFSCHLVLRGSEKGPNYAPHLVQATVEKCQRSGVTNRLAIDCSHDNCGKISSKQVHVFQEVIHQILEGSPYIAGSMLESHLYSGSQPLTKSLRYGVSITDPCLDWETTEFLIKEAYSKLKKHAFCLV